MTLPLKRRTPPFSKISTASRTTAVSSSSRYLDRHWNCRHHYHFSSSAAAAVNSASFCNSASSSRGGKQQQRNFTTVNTTTTADYYSPFSSSSSDTTPPEHHLISTTTTTTTKRSYATSRRRAPRTLLVDGTPLVCRSFHGTKQEMSTVDGVPTNGVLTYIRTLIRSMPADYYDYVAVFFESKNNFRKGLLEDYKGTRAKQDDRLVKQFPIAIEATKLMHVHCESQDQYEADDLIASYATKCYDNGHQVHILTNDKDLYQLVNDRIHVVNIRDGLYDAERIHRKFGVPPHKFIMYQALMGDQIDNIPGIPGIGKKTGMQLAQQFENIDHLIENVHLIKQPKIRNSVKQNITQLRLSIQLVTLRRDLETKSLDDLRTPQTVKNPEFIEFLKKYEFNSILHALNGTESTSRKAAKRSRQVKAEKAKFNTKSAAAQEEVSPTQEEEETTAEEKEAPANPAITHVIDPKSDTITTEYLPGYRSLLTISQVRSYLDQAMHSSPHIAIKTLISSEDTHDNILIGISLSHKEGEAVYIPFLTDDIPSNYFEAIEAIKRSDTFQLVKTKLLENPDIKKIGVDMKRELKNLYHYDTFVENYDDAMVISYVLNCGKHLHELVDLMTNVLGITESKSKVLIDKKLVLGVGSKKVPFSQAPLIPVTNHVCQLSDYALKSFNALDPQLRASKKLHKFYLKLEKPLIRALAGVEVHGASVNIEAFQALQEGYEKKIEETRAKILEECGEPELNINSTQQLGEVLFDKMKIGLEFARRSTKSGHYVLNVEVLNKLAKKGYKVAEKILEYRALIKLQSTYILGLQKHINPYTHRIHPTYMNCITVTGRLSCTEPNLQNIPNRNEEGRVIRKLFVAPPGHCLMKVDYSQVELRILAHIAKIDVLREAFRNGADIHSTTAASVFNKPMEEVEKSDRQKAKSINFGIIYGMSEFGLSKQIDVSVAEAKEYIAQYFKRYPGIQHYMQKASSFCRKFGFVQTFFGRKCWVPGINSPYQNVQSFAERTSINTPIQGSSADITKMAMVKLYDLIREKGMRTRMIMQVHDEIVFEVPMDEREEAANLIKEAMEAADTSLGKTFSIPLPVDVDICKNWVEKMTEEEIERETLRAQEMAREREQAEREELERKEKLENERRKEKLEQLERRRQEIQMRRYSVGGVVSGEATAAASTSASEPPANGSSFAVKDFDPEPVFTQQRDEDRLNGHGLNGNSKHLSQQAFADEDDEDYFDVDDNLMGVLNGEGKMRRVLDEEEESDLEEEGDAFLNPTANPARGYESEDDDMELDENAGESVSRVIGLSRPYESDDEEDEELLDGMSLDDVAAFRPQIVYESDDDEDEEEYLQRSSL